MSKTAKVGTALSFMIVSGLLFGISSEIIIMANLFFLLGAYI